MNQTEKLPVALAIVKDSRRRAGLRVCRIRVCVRYDDMHAAGVEEMTPDRTPHYLPFTRLCRLSRRREELPLKLRAAVAERMKQAELTLTAPAQGLPADTYTLAHGGAV